MHCSKLMLEHRSCVLIVAAGVARRREGVRGIIFPAVASCGANQIPLPSQKVAKGEDLRRMSRTTTTHAYHLPVQNPACAGAGGAGGGVSTPAKKADRFCSTPYLFIFF